MGEVQQVGEMRNWFTVFISVKLGSCEHDNELSGSIKKRGPSDSLSKY
jgi:hypothetical protein